MVRSRGMSRFKSNTYHAFPHTGYFAWCEMWNRDLEEWEDHFEFLCMFLLVVDTILISKTFGEELVV